MIDSIFHIQNSTLQNLSLKSFFNFNREYAFLNWKWTIIIWTSIAVISSSLLFVKLSIGGDTPSWLSIFIIKLVIWLFWGAVMPLIFFLSKKFRVDRGNRFKGLLFHVPFSVFLISLNIFLYALIVFLTNVDDYSAQALIGIFATLFINQFEWYLIIYWAIIIVGYAFEFYQKYKEREITALQLESKLIKAQLQTLKMQLHPHFLFNTLNTIAALVRYDDKKSAVAMLAGISDLLRMALMQRGQHEVKLEMELDFISKYLEIEKIRFKDKLEIEIDMDPKTSDVIVPNFLLQPIVENAIYHGVSKQIVAKRITIQTTLEQEQLIIKVYNDGPEFPANFDVQKTKGIGLSNTIERLSQLYGDNHEINFNNVGEGVEVVVKLPYIKN
ncbi:histidine kinase [Fulvivirgaceae bacterium BMA10]|uniref:Histidine kinase n=1 Tax=Splendidivirga corallicola TaxID=3051826 RepID=A0ABT8KWT4_9BACT|nr:histidine kinase [Fulvivirgaceae bacterium BMA10]